MGRARLALSFVSGCPGRGVPAFLGYDLRVRAQLPGWWLCAHAGPSFVILGYPGPVGGSNRVQPIYTLRQTALHQCCSFCSNLMLMFRHPISCLKQSQSIQQISHQYKLTHRKVCEFSCGIPDITTHTQISRIIRVQCGVQWYTGFIQLLFHYELFLVVRSLLDVLRFLHNDFQ